MLELEPCYKVLEDLLHQANRPIAIDLYYYSASKVWQTMAIAPRPQGTIYFEGVGADIQLYFFDGAPRFGGGMIPAQIGDIFLWIQYKLQIQC